MSLKLYASIISGWTNFAFPSKTVEELATTRAKICSSCDHADPEYPFKKLLPEENRIEEIKGLGCNLCGCPLQSKLRSIFEKCPDTPSKW